MPKIVLIFFTVVSILGSWSSIALGAPQCQTVFKDSFNINESMEIQLAELKHALKDLRHEIKESKDRKDPMSSLKEIETDPRELAYLLQGAYRLILSNPQAQAILSGRDLKIVRRGLSELKKFEKDLGQYSVQTDLLKTARKSEMAPDFLRYLKDRRRKVSQSVYHKLKDDNYLNGNISAVGKLSQKIQKFQIPEGVDSKQWLQDSLASEIQRVLFKVQTEMAPLIRSPKFGYHEIENGAHAFRRSLRWLKVYIESYPDFFTLKQSAASDATVTAFRAKFKIGYDEPGKIALKDTEYAKILEFVDTLKKVKKAGEMKELLTQELIEFGQWNGSKINREQAEQIMEQFFHQEGNLQKIAQDILREFEARDGFRFIFAEATL